jgi:hypothetical protein
MDENPRDSPPPVLDCARVLRYLLIDVSMEFSGRTLLFVDGKELGEVPYLAICEKEKNGGVLLFHCTSDWTVLGCSSHKSITDAQERAEAIYRGSSSRWVDANVSREAAEAYLDELFGGDRCSLCGNRPHQVDSFISQGSDLICNHCARTLT